MAGISFDFKNIVRSKKCAVSSPRIVSLEVGDESPGSASESVFQGIHLSDQIGGNDIKNNTDLICGHEKQNVKNLLFHSPSSLSTYDDRPSDKIKPTNDSDIDLVLLDLLHSADKKQAVKTGAGDSNPKATGVDSKMKITSNVEVNNGISDILSLIHDISEKNTSDSNLEYRLRKNTQDCEIDMQNIEIAKDECADSVSSNNSSLKIKGNLSDLLSSINTEDSNVTNNSSNMCNLKFAKKSEMEKEPSIADLSDLLSSIDLGDLSDNKVGSSNIKVLESKNESCLADLLSSINIEDYANTKNESLNSSNKCNSEVVNKSKMENESSIADLSDLLSSIDLRDSNDNKADNCNSKDLTAENESCLADLLLSIDIDKSNKPASALCNKPLSYGKSDLYFKGANDTSDLLSDFMYDITSCSSTSNSCASSYSEKDNSPKETSSNINTTDKIFESDSGYSSVDSADKGFSFFDYSSDNQLSFNTLLTKKSDARVVAKQPDSANATDEMSMSDLMTIVSPEFKKAVLGTMNMEELDGSVNKESSSMLDCITSLNGDSFAVCRSSVKCDDGKINRDIHKGMKAVDVQVEKNDVSFCGGDFISNDEEQLTVIDLRECIKSAALYIAPTSPIKQHKSIESRSPKHLTPSKILFYCEDKSPTDISQNRSNPFEFNNIVFRKKSKVNTKQTLFSKALACKPKKDHSLLQKVADIKNELLNNIINRPVFIDCEVPQPIMESVRQSNRCILSSNGRINFGMHAPCELQ